MSVVPWLLTRNPAMPNHRIVVLLDGRKASFPKGCVGGAVAWYFFSFFDPALSAVDCACTRDGRRIMAIKQPVCFEFIFVKFKHLVLPVQFNRSVWVLKEQSSASFPAYGLYPFLFLLPLFLIEPGEWPVFQNGWFNFTYNSSHLWKPFIISKA